MSPPQAKPADSQPTPALWADPARRARVWPWLIALAAAAVYANTLPNQFVFDDTGYVARALKRPLAELPGVFVSSRRPLVELSLSLNAAVSGEAVWSYRVLNLAVHALAAVALYGLVRRTLTAPRVAPRYAGRADVVAGAAALLWAVHPLATQAVSYMIQRGESMASLFYLLTLYGVARCAGAASRRGVGGFGALAVAACAAGVGSKEIIISAPFVALLYDRAFFAGGFGKALRARWGVYAGLLGAIGLYGLMPSADLTAVDNSAGFGMSLLSPTAYLLSQGEVILYYLRLAVWPSPLVFDYMWTPAYLEGDWWWSAAVVAGLLVGSLVGVVLNRWWGVVGLACFGVLAPSSSVIPIVDVLVEHRAYLLLGVVLVLIVLGVDWGLRRLPNPEAAARLGGLGLLVAAVSLGGLTLIRNYAYRTPESLWLTVTERAPLNPRGHHNYAAALDRQGRLEEALRAYVRSVEVLPTYGPGARKAGAVLLKLGEPAEALRWIDRSLEYDPDSAEAHHWRARALVALGRVDEAWASAERAVELDPDSAEAHETLGAVALRRGDAAAAEAALGRAVALDPELGAAQQSLGALYLNTGRPAEAIEPLRAALTVDPLATGARVALGGALAQLGRLDEARAELARTVRDEPRSAAGWRALGRVEQLRGDAAAAAAAYRRSLALQPDQPGVARALEEVAPPASP